MWTTEAFTAAKETRPMFAATLVIGAAGALLLGGAGAETSFVVVAEALEALASTEAGKSGGKFPAGIEVWENGSGRSSAADLAAYAGQCPLDRIERSKLAGPPAGQILIAVSWRCADGVVANEALFVVAGEKIESVSFRPVPIVRVR